MKRAPIIAVAALVSLLLAAWILWTSTEARKVPVAPTPDANTATPKPSTPTPEPTPPLAPPDALPENDALRALTANIQELSTRKISKDGTCTEDDQCPTGLTRCEGGQCQEPSICLSDKDCLGVRVCYKGACTDNPEGCRERDCVMKGMVCNDHYGQCEKLACANNNDCAGPRRCDTNIGTCFDCLEDSDCSGGDACRSGFCLPPEGCMGDGDCEGEQICDTFRGTCHDTSSCVDDPLEDNDTRDKARAIEPGTTQGTLCPDDDDWYALEVAPDEGFVFHLDYDATRGNVELRLYDPEGKAIGQAGDSEPNGAISLPWEKVDKPGLYTLRVKYYQGISIPYRLRVERVAGGFCEDDFWEPNDTADEARALTQGMVLDMKLCDSRDDWYTQPVGSGRTLDLMLEQRGGEPPIVALFRPGQDKPLLVNDTEDELRQIAYTNDGDDADILIRIFHPWSENETSYGLQVGIRAPKGEAKTP